MNALDWTLVAILVYSTIRAFFRGIIRKLLSLLGFIAAILLASWNYQKLATQLGRFVTGRAAITQIVAFLLILGVVLVLSAMLGKALHGTAHAIGLGLPDRLLGAAFGFARGCLIGVAILVAATAFLPQSAWVAHSEMSPYFLEGAHAVSFVVPHDLRQQILDGTVRLKHKAPDWIKPAR